MRKTRTINVKTMVMSTLLEDLRISMMFNEDNFNNIYPYLKGNHKQNKVDNYIYFDMAETNDKYKLIFEIISHIDIKEGGSYYIDRIVEYIQEDVMKIFPMCRNFYIKPSKCNDNYIEKRIFLSIYKCEMSATH